MHCLEATSSLGLASKVVLRLEKTWGAAIRELLFFNHTGRPSCIAAIIVSLKRQPLPEPRVDAASQVLHLGEFVALNGLHDNEFDPGLPKGSCSGIFLKK